MVFLCLNELNYLVNFFLFYIFTIGYGKIIFAKIYLVLDKGWFLLILMLKTQYFSWLQCKVARQLDIPNWGLPLVRFLYYVLL